MGERTVLNKCNPSDMDRLKLPTFERPKSRHVFFRMMLPTSIRCNTCGNCIHRGTRLNSRRECITGQFTKLQICRLYFNCTSCFAEMTLKEDLQNFEWVVESGAKRISETCGAEDEAKHATSSIDAMPDNLQRTAAEKEKKIEEEADEIEEEADESLIRLRNGGGMGSWVADVGAETVEEVIAETMEG